MKLYRYTQYDGMEEAPTGDYEKYGHDEDFYVNMEEIMDPYDFALGWTRIPGRDDLEIKTLFRRVKS